MRDPPDLVAARPWDRVPFTPGDIAWVVLPTGALVSVAIADEGAPLGWAAWIATFLWMFAAPRVVRARRWRASPGDARPARARFLPELGVGALGFAALVAIWFAVVYAISAADGPAAETRYGWTRYASPSTLRSAWLWLLIALGTTLGPLAEETFYRGFLLHALGRRIGIWLAALMQLALFVVLHRAALGESIALVLDGLVLTGLALWRRSVVAASIAHLASNTLQFVVMILVLAQPKPAIGVRCVQDQPHCRIERLTRGGPAERAGLLPDQVIVAVNGKPCETPAALLRAVVRSGAPGATLRLSIEAHGATREVVLTTVDRDSLTP